MNKVIIGLLAVALFFGCGQSDSEKSVQPTAQQVTSDKKQEVAQKNQSVEQKKSSIEFTLKTIDNKIFHFVEIPNGFKIKELEGKNIFLVFFGHQCPPCLREIPRLIEMQKEHKDLAIIAIEVQGLSTQQLQEFVKAKGINYNVISMGSSMRFINYIQAKAGWNGSIPFLITFNKEGKVVIIHTGGLFKEHLEQAYAQTNK